MDGGTISTKPKRKRHERLAKADSDSGDKVDTELVVRGPKKRYCKLTIFDADLYIYIDQHLESTTV